MDAAIRVEAPVLTGAGGDALIAAISSILVVGAESRTAEAVLLKALDVLQNCVPRPGPVSIANCHIENRE